MNQHSSIAADLTTCEPDPRAAHRKKQSIADLAKLTKLKAAINSYELYLIDSVIDGRWFEAADIKRLEIAELYADLEGIDSSFGLHELIENLRHDLGLTQFDPTDIDLCGKRMGVGR